MPFTSFETRPASAGVSRPASKIETSRPDRPIRVVFVDDDDLYRDTVEVELVEQGFQVQAFSDGEAMMASFAGGLDADVVLLDWGLTKTAGIDLLPQMRDRGIDLPVVFLTGRNSPIHERLALGRGAVDFIDKARGIDILGPRLQLVARKWAAARAPEAEEVVQHGRLSLNNSRRRAFWDACDVNLTLTEFGTVSLLVANAGSYVGFRQIYDGMHYAGFAAGTGDDGYRTNVRAAIKRIRAKFKAVCADFDEITTYSGFGYCWAPSVAEDVPKAAD